MNIEKITQINAINLKNIEAITSFNPTFKQDEKDYKEGSDLLLSAIEQFKKEIKDYGKPEDITKLMITMLLTSLCKIIIRFKAPENTEKYPILKDLN